MSKHPRADGSHQDDLLAAIGVLADLYADNAAKRHPDMDAAIVNAHLTVVIRDAVRTRCSMTHTDSGAHLLRQLATGFGHMADDIDRQPLT